MKTLTIIIAAGIFASTASARLEETSEQCAARYGEPLERVAAELPGSEQRSYETGKFKVVVGFLNDKAGYLLISKRDQSKFSAEEVNLLLGANSGGSSWQRVEENRISQKLHRADNRATAIMINDDALMLEAAFWRAAKAGMSQF
jgi:hypothetical protein